MPTWAEILHQQAGSPEIVKRARGSLHVKGPGRSILALCVGRPLHYHDGSEWQPIDPTLRTLPSGRWGGLGTPISIGTDGAVYLGGSGYSQRTTSAGEFTPATSAYRTLWTLPGGLVNGDRLTADGGSWRFERRLLEDGYQEVLTLVTKPSIQKSVSHIALDTVVSGVSFPDGPLGEWQVAEMTFPLPAASDASGNLAPTKRYARTVSGVQHVYSVVPASWLASASYPVTVDPDFAAIAASGQISSDATTYAAANATSNYPDDTGASIRVGQGVSGGWYQCYRGFVGFDTSAITTANTVTQVNLTLTALNDFTAASDFDVQIRKHNWTGTWNIAANRESDFDGAIAADLDQTWRNTSGMSTSTPYTSPNLANAWVARTGTTKYALVSDRDVAATTPSGNESVQFASDSYPTVGYRPVLAVLYSTGEIVAVAGAASATVTLSGDIGLSLYSLTGSATASASLSGDGSQALCIVTGEALATASLQGNSTSWVDLTGQAYATTSLVGDPFDWYFECTGRATVRTTLRGTMMPLIYNLSGEALARASGTAPVPYEISESERVRYANASASYRIALGFTTAYSPSITNVLRDEDDPMHEHLSWKPFVRFGCNRLALTGESLKFYAGNCYNSTGGGIENRYKTFSWGDGSPDTPLTGRDTGVDGGIAYHSYAAPGCYTVTLSVNDPVYGTAHGHRYVRVVSSWDNAVSDVVAIGPVSGSISQGGWQTTLTVPTTTAASITDGMGVVLRVLARWGQDVTGSGGEPAPTDGFYESPLFTGYVVGNSIDWDWEKEEVTFKVQTADYWLNQIWSYEQHFYSDGQEGYGHFRSSGNISYPWVINHMLNVHSNFAEYHDVVVFIDNAVQQKSIVVGEGPIWQSMKDYARTEFAQTYVTKDGMACVVPNKNVRGYSWWGSYLNSPTLLLDESVVLKAQIEELPTDRVGFVRLEANDHFSKEILKAKYPTSPAAKGEWITESGVVFDSQSRLDAYAERIYRWKNYRYEARLTVGSFWMFDLGQVVPVDLDDPNGKIALGASVGGGLYRRPFDLNDLTFNVDVENDNFTIDVGLADIPNVRWNESAYRWEWYEDGSWHWVGPANQM